MSDLKNSDLAQDSGLPMVSSDRGNAPLWLGFALIALLAISLFVIMEGRRQRQLEPSVRPSATDGAGVATYEPPPLQLPEPIDEPKAATDPPLVSTATPPPAPAQAFIPPASYYPPPAYSPPPSQATPAPQSAQTQQASVIVYDVSAGEPATGAATGGGAATTAPQSKSPEPAYAGRGRASRLTTMVARGTLIPAVLETALDSTQPGQARALISEDVRNLNGDRVLIPRGSRLFGEYRADVAAGQRRAFVQWNELIRPDGAVIAIESPATDPLGRAGVRGKVNSHFGSRLGGALLQSAIDFGTIAGAQAISRNGVIVASPALQAGTSQLVGPMPKPSLSVKQGTKISVLVSRDLEFAPVELPQ